MKYRVTEIERARRMKGWTQARLAAVAGMHASTITRIERGIVQPGPATAKKLADALGLDMAELIEEEPSAV